LAQLIGQAAGRMQVKKPLSPAERFGEALIVKGLDEIVDRGDFERLQCILIERGHKDSRGHIVGTDSPHHFEAGLARHLHIEKNEIRFEFRDGAYGRIAVVRSAGNLPAWSH
jgi:hypothetical protein